MGLSKKWNQGQKVMKNWYTIFFMGEKIRGGGGKKEKATAIYQGATKREGRRNQKSGKSVKAHERRNDLINCFRPLVVGMTPRGSIGFSSTSVG